MEKPKLYYWAGVGPEDGKYFASTKYGAKADGGPLFEGSVAMAGLPDWSQFIAKTLFAVLKAKGYEPELINDPPSDFGGKGRKLTTREERELLDALKGR